VCYKHNSYFKFHTTVTKQKAGTPLKEKINYKNKIHKATSLVEYTVLTSITSLVYKVEKNNFQHCRNCQSYDYSL